MKAWALQHTKKEHFKAMNAAMEEHSKFVPKLKPASRIVVSTQSETFEYSTGFIFLNSYSQKVRKCVSCKADIPIFLPRLEVIAKKTKIGATDRTGYAKFDYSSTCHCTAECITRHPAIKESKKKNLNKYPTCVMAHITQQYERIMKLDENHQPSWASDWKNIWAV